jgi:Uma2 family endonuclease
MTLIADQQVRRFTRDEYYRMAEIGLFDGERVELINGEIIRMSPQNNPHSWALSVLSNTLSRMLPATVTIRTQMPLAVDDMNHPEPDLAVIDQPLHEMGKDHPSTALIVVEVADSSLRLDRKKAALYARAGVPEYGIVNLNEQCVEIYTQPVRETVGKDAWDYRSRRIAKPGDSIVPIALKIPPFDVKSLFPRR